MNTKQKLLLAIEYIETAQAQNDKALLPFATNKESRSLEEKNYSLDEKRKKRKERKEEKLKYQQAEKRKLILLQVSQTKENICQLIEKSEELMQGRNENNFSIHIKFIQIIKNNLEDNEETPDNDYLKTKFKILKSSLLKLIEIHSRIKLEVKIIESIKLIN